MAGQSSELRKCAAHKHRSVVPLDEHHILPLADGGTDELSNTVILCPNAHREVHEYLRELKYEAEKGLFRLDKRFFGPKIREIARKGFAAIGEDD